MKENAFGDYLENEGGLDFIPEDYQVAGREHLLSNREAALFTGMGLGKSATVLSALDARFIDGDCKGALIVAPLRVATCTWPDEVKKWKQFSWMVTADLRSEEGKQQWDEKRAHLYIINYEMLPKFCREQIHGRRAGQMGADTIIFDELSIAKNPASKRIKAISGYQNKFRTKWGLTGTPIPNSHFDLFAQIRLLDGGKSWLKLQPDRNRKRPVSATEFKAQHFCISNPDAVEYGKARPKFEVRPESKELISNAISDIVLTQRTEDFTDIPETFFEDVPVAMPAAAKKIYTTLERDLMVLLDTETNRELLAVNAGVLVMKLLQVTGGAVYTQEGEDLSTREATQIHTAKVQALKRLHKAQGGQPMLVIYQFKHEQERLVKAGCTPWAEKLLPKWNKGEIPLMCAHPKAIGHGLNLQDGGSRICWFSLNYSREMYDQTNCRLARKGQGDFTQVFHLMMHGFADDAVKEALRHKGSNQSGFLQTLKNLQRLAKR
tara:strand:+ start:737 stop:2212 length:1476 start_codon:yes stop_codon:yes gene_type:complete